MDIDASTCKRDGKPHPACGRNSETDFLWSNAGLSGPGQDAGTGLLARLEAARAMELTEEARS
jgi:hypothetical protein